MERKHLAGIVGTVAIVSAGLVVYSSRNESSKAAVAPSPQAEFRPVPEPVAPRSEISAVIAQIQELQMPSATRKRMIVAYLRSDTSPREASSRYWEPAALRDAAERIQGYQADESVRNQLRSMFGDAVVEDPEFAFLFRPFAERYPTLSGAKQLQLQKLSLMPAQALLESGLSPIQAQVKVRASQREMQELIAKLLTTEELREYERKESAAARALANGGFRFTQQEFDAVLASLASPADEVGTRRFDPETNQKLRTLMGERRFLDYRKSQDPTFHMLSTIVAAHGRPDSNVDAAYEAVFKNQEASAEMLRAGPVLGFEAQKKKDGMTTQLRSQLATNIGDEAADIFMRSMDANRGLVQTRM